LVDLNAALPTLAARDVSALLRLPELDLGALATAIAGAADTTLVPPGAAVSFRPLLPTAGKILCLGVNFVDHAKESSHDKPAYPVVFGRWPSSFVGHEQPLVVPAVSHHFDYESELLVVIGKRGHRITREAALSHVAGYSLMNDGSIRDYQKRTAQWTVGKNFDASGSLGPELVTADELPAGAVGLRLTGKLNGVVMQEASTSDMIFDVVDAIVSLSEGMALEPGDAIAMGTPGGVGFVRTPPVFMRAGDVFEIEIERVGVLRNGIVDEVLAGRLAGAFRTPWRPRGEHEDALGDR
jgi:2-keto-4-pentenoate hydratase/2-oxohepta-3-ene-1,7-dioic acid hydratase in catechol pathway